MNASGLANVFPVLLSELVHGSPNPDAGTYMLNRGDTGLLKSLDKLPAPVASATSGGGVSIAAHVDHLRYGLSLLNRWAAGEARPWEGADWKASWRTITVSDDEWRALRESLRREAEAWLEALRVPRDLGEAELTFVAGSIAHLAYHMGAIRQIDRGARGPTAEEEERHRQTS